MYKYFLFILTMLISSIFLITCYSVAKKDTEQTTAAIAEYDVLLERAMSIYDTMSLDERVGQLFILRVAQNTKGVSAEFEALLDAVLPGGVLFFQNNIDTTEQITQFIASIQHNKTIPLFISADMEGGAINRFKASGHPLLSKIPSAKVMSESQTPAEMQEYAFSIGQALRAIGFNMNFAPVADVKYPSTHPFLHERIFGTDANTTAIYNIAFMKGQGKAGVMSVMKHFPGHGGAVNDTHKDTASIPFDREHLQNNDFIPYMRAIAEGRASKMPAVISAVMPAIMPEIMPAVMLGHLQVDALDENNIATVSAKTIQILKNDIGFQGLIITDSLRMGGVLRAVGAQDAADARETLEIQALQAGVHILLDPIHPRKAKQAILEAIQQKRISEDTLKDRVVTILLYKLFWIAGFN